MRKTDKRCKPQLHKIGTNKIGTLKPTKEELAHASEVLEFAKTMERKTIMLPKGYATAYKFK